MKKIMTLFIGILMSGYINSQTFVNPGDGTLSAAIQAASDGDVLQLQPGSEYTTANQNFGTITKKITIETADPSNTVLPKVYSTYTAATGGTAAQYFILDNGGSLTLDGIEFTGEQPSAPGVAAERNLISYPAAITAAINCGTLAIKNCVIHHFTSDVIDGASVSNFYYVTQDSIIIDNSIIYNTGLTPLSGTSGSIVQFKYTNCNYFMAENSTFYGINSYGLRFEGGSSYPNTNPPEGHINHCTFDNVGGGKNFVLVEYSKKPWLVTNTIFSNLQSSSQRPLYFKKNSSDSVIATLERVCLWNYGDNHDWWKFINASATDTLVYDPKYTNAANGDFTLLSGDTLLTTYLGTDGKVIGDPRWAGNFTAVNDHKGLPLKFSLNQNYPNPFNPSTTISFSLDRAGFTSLIVYNMLGQRVAYLVNKNLSSGSYKMNFNAVNLTSGVYIYQLKSGNLVNSKKMILLK